MKRFLMLVGVAVVAAAMYVAASPASQQAGGPTMQQFNLLKKQVAALSKKLKTTKSEADESVGFLATCFLSNNAGVWGVDEFGDPNGVTEGYVYQPPGVVPTVKTTALDFSSSLSPTAWFQAVDPTCVKTALRHRLKLGSTTRLPLAGERSH
jgi:opacity protein-like surface antigen